MLNTYNRLKAVQAYIAHVMLKLARTGENVDEFNTLDDVFDTLDDILKELNRKMEENAFNMATEAANNWDGIQ